jgi:anti-sigma28 factor (negative regulator of flagellin synthesis)
MRIEPTDKSFRVEPTSPSQPDTVSAPARSGSDHVELSAFSHAASALSPQRIDEIRNQVSSGTYDVSAADVSHSIVNFYLTPLK